MCDDGVDMVGSVSAERLVYAMLVARRLRRHDEPSAQPLHASNSLEAVT